MLGVGCGTTDRHTALETFGAPEHYLGNAAACDLCHFYGLPSFAYAAVSDAKLLDEQWAAEAAISAVLGRSSRATLLHDVGYLEAGLQSSFETIVLGHELVSYARALMHEVGTDRASLAVREICAVGPGGSFADLPTRASTAPTFWSPALFERNGFEHWQAAGATTLKERVRARSEALRHEPPAFTLSDAERRATDEIVNKAKGGPVSEATAGPTATVRRGAAPRAAARRRGRALHEAALELLASRGVPVAGAVARELLVAAGATADRRHRPPAPARGARARAPWRRRRPRSFCRAARPTATSWSAAAAAACWPPWPPPPTSPRPRCSPTPCPRWRPWACPPGAWPSCPRCWTRRPSRCSCAAP